MTAVWMLYATLVATLIAAATLLAERGVRALRWPARWLWMGAIAGSLIIPVVGLWMRGDAERPLERSMATSLVDPEAYTRSLSGDATSDHRQPTLMERAGARGMALAGALDAPFLALWALGSLAILGILALSAARLARAKREWQVALVDDQFVRISEDTGPAVVGFAPSEIVLPEWAVAMSPEQRAMLLAHEREHIRARDPLLLYAGLAALVLAPWNAALWWQLRRLRLAVEMDCDARVLRACSDVRAYGALLIEVGRRTVRAPLAAAAFSEPATHLERRIHMMLARPPRFRVLRALTLGVAGLALAFVACDMQAPMGPAPENEVALEELGANGKSFNVKDGVDGSRLHAAIREHFPELLREAGDTLWTLTFVQDHTGQIVQAHKQPYPRESASEEFLRRQAVELEATRARAAMRADRIEVRGGAGEVVLLGTAGTADTLAGELSLPSKVSRRRAEASGREERALLERELLKAATEARAALPADRTARDERIVLREVPVRRALGPRIPSSKVGGTDVFDKLDPDLIQSVEIIKGSAIEFPAATGGVIWIQLKQRMTF